MAEVSSAEHPFAAPAGSLNNEEFARQLHQRFSMLSLEIPKAHHFSEHPVYGPTDFIVTNWALRVAVHNWTKWNKDFTVPLKCIYLIEKKGGRRRPGLYGIEITANTTAHLFIPFPKKEDLRPNFFNTLIENWKSPFTLPESVYESDHGWEEDLRVKSGWTFIQNDFCSSYPKRILIPPDVSMDTIKEVARFRSKGRLPFLSYIHPSTHAPLLRSAQPLTGITNSSSPADTEYLSHINANRDFQIYDCRPKLNAVVNIFTGGGYESADNYSNASFLFFSIPNIHRVRDCYIEMREGIDAGKEKPWANWSELITQIIQSSVQSAEALKSNKAVLVHCTDGWDRTAQISAITQILVDPFSRTINGFKALIQKEWCDAGHMFSLRCAHQPITKSDESAPIFIQFIDALLQIMKTNQNMFEFNQKLPIFVAFHAYSQLYGDFLYPNCQIRDEKPRPQSLWQNMQSPEFSAEVVNRNYATSTDAITDIRPYEFIEDLHCPIIFGGGNNLPML